MGVSCASDQIPPIRSGGCSADDEPQGSGELGAKPHLVNLHPPPGLDQTAELEGPPVWPGLAHDPGRRVGARVKRIEAARAPLAWWLMWVWPPAINAGGHGGRAA